ncbi:MAG: carboxypeptidase regulatory-like domain-containing protein [Planctomycetes bacterium]|nr:carboxypeptidase regulatory-like domain-containing protein [Planctomycetota bacterium]MCW8135061.1 carboxypeptidase regulatory-like domain-containing protein [Planctomycetota bacterium]
MRNSRLPILALLILVVIAAIVGTYFLLNDPRPAPQHNDVALDGGPDSANNPPNTPGPGARGNQTSQPGPGHDTPKPGPGPDTPKPGPDTPKPGPNTPKPGPDNPQPGTEWQERTIDLKITGTVRYKVDQRPAAGAQVTGENMQGGGGWWAGPQPPGGSARPAKKFIGEAVTDGAGEYTLNLKVTWYSSADRIEGDEDWTAGGIQVVARMSGYAPARSEAIWVARATRDHKINLQLAVPAGISGRVIDAATRKGIHGANVSLWSTDGDQGGARHLTTDEQGYFSINDLPAGVYSLWVNAQGYSGMRPGEGVGRIDVARGGERNVGDIALTRAAAIIGRVLMQDGKPAVEAAVNLQIRGGGWMGNRAHSASTAEDGRFKLEEVEAGVYDLTARLEGVGVVTLEQLNVEAGKERDVGDLKLEKGLTLAGIVTDKSGRGVAGAVVSIRAGDSDNPFGGRWRDSVASTTTNAQGRFEIVAMQEGEFRAVVNADGYARLDHSFKFPGSELRLVLSRGGSVEGRVVNQNNEPVHQASVSLISHNDPQYTWFKASPEQNMWGGSEWRATTEQGSWQIENVPPGTYLVVARADSVTGWVDDIVVDDEKRANAGEIKLGGTGTLRVTVTEDGQPVPDLKVTVVRGMAFGRGGDGQNTDSNGVVEINGLAEGTWTIMTSRDESNFDTEAMKKRAVTIKAGQVTEFALELRPKDGTRLHGKLTLNGKTAFSELILAGTGERADVIKQGRIDSGFYEFLGLSAGVYLLHARISDEAVSCMARVEISAPGELEFTRDFKGYVISGSVTTPGNTPLQNSAVRISLQHASPDVGNVGQWLAGRANCDEQGRFRIEGVCAGDYTLSAILDGVGNARMALKVEASDRTGLSLAIDDNVGSVRVKVSKLHGKTLSGTAFGFARLIDAAGQPVAMADQNAGFMMVAENATTELVNVSPGKYTLELAASGYLPASKTDVNVEKAARTEVLIELTAAAELHVTATNPEITQAIMDTAKARYFDAQGKELPPINNVFDAWGAAAPAPEKPTYKVAYIGPTVTEIRVKVPGYAEVAIPVQFEAGKKLTHEASLAAE